MSRRLLLMAVVACAPLTANGQVESRPYSAQLRTDPAFGTIHGIQRYGRANRTDPAEGDANPLYVFPTVDHGTRSGNDLARRMAAAVNSRSQSAPAGADADSDRNRPQSIRSGNRSGSMPGSPFPQPLRSATPYGNPYFPTAGMRLPPMPTGAVGTTESIADEAFSAEAIVVNNALGAGSIPNTSEIFHQPLIQVRVRVVEVARDDTLQFGSVLDYIASHSAMSKASFIQTNNINNNLENLTSATRFPGPSGLLGITGTALTSGTGGLINLTSKHINFIARFLATELSADVITAPQVVTLNGQNVEFTSGNKVPFNLGQNVMQDNANAIQQFFYKHVGTYISVTPRIVNWGPHAEGRGNAEIAATEVVNWNRLIRFLVEQQLDKGAISNSEVYSSDGVLVPLEVRSAVLRRVNVFARDDLRKFIDRRRQSDPSFTWTFEELIDESRIVGCDSYGFPCQWKPEHCTIDLEVIVRLSDAGVQALSVTRGVDANGAVDDEIAVSAEDNVRAVANVLQVKSGNGVVMAGLIGEREIEEVSKIPVLGDIPIAGALFRSKGTNRQKTEVLIFIEAEVLDPRPEAARAQSSRDFALGRPYVQGDFLSNPLEYGMYRAGFGTYLPPHSDDETLFWERLGRKVRKAETAIDDALK